MWVTTVLVQDALLVIPLPILVAAAMRHIAVSFWRGVGTDGRSDAASPLETQSL
jgi:hypothetical protein